MESETCEMLYKTSHERYLKDKEYDILDPIGWKNLNDSINYWYNAAIDENKYKSLRSESTVTEYMKNKHKVPFEESKRTEYETYLDLDYVQCNIYEGTPFE